MSSTRYRQKHPDKARLSARKSNFQLDGRRELGQDASKSAIAGYVAQREEEWQQRRLEAAAQVRPLGLFI